MNAADLRQTVFDRLAEYQASQILVARYVGCDPLWIWALQNAKRAREAMLSARAEWYREMGWKEAA